MSSDSAWDVDALYGMEPPAPVSQKKPAVQAPMPDIYESAPVTEKHTAEKHTADVVDPSLPNIDKFVGFNPYDTGILQKKLSED